MPIPGFVCTPYKESFFKRIKQNMGKNGSESLKPKEYRLIKEFIDLMFSYSLFFTQFCYLPPLFHSNSIFLHFNEGSRTVYRIELHRRRLLVLWKIFYFSTICPCFLGQSNILNGSQDIHETKVEIKSNQIKSNFGIDWHVSSEKFWKFYVGVQSILEGIQNENFVCFNMYFWVALGWCISVGYWNLVSVTKRHLQQLEMF